MAVNKDHATVLIGGTQMRAILAGENAFEARNYRAAYNYCGI